MWIVTRYILRYFGKGTTASASLRFIWSHKYTDVTTRAALAVASIKDGASLLSGSLICIASMSPSLTLQRVPSSCSGTALARLIPEPPSLLGPNLCTSYYADNSPSTKAHNLSRIIEEHDGTLSHFNNGRATHRSHAPHAPISSRSNQTRMTRVSSNLSEASQVIKPTAPPMNIKSDKVTMEMVNQFEINRRLHQSRALPKTFTSTRHRRAHIARYSAPV